MYKFRTWALVVATAVTGVAVGGMQHSGLAAQEVPPGATCYEDGSCRFADGTSSPAFDSPEDVVPTEGDAGAWFAAHPGWRFQWNCETMGDKGCGPAKPAEVIDTNPAPAPLNSPATKAPHFTG